MNWKAAKASVRVHTLLCGTERILDYSVVLVLFQTNLSFIIGDICVRLTADVNCSVSSLSTATKADSFALYFLGECNNVSTRGGFCLDIQEASSVFNRCYSLFFSTEFMFIHSNGAQRWPSKPRPLRPHRIWDNHRRLCCQDSQNRAGGGHHGGTAAILKPQKSQSLQSQVVKSKPTGLLLVLFPT